jgi:hypothetical protein
MKELICLFKKVKLMQSLYKPCWIQQFEPPRFQNKHHMNVVMLSALHTGRLYFPVNIPGTHLPYRLSQTPLHIVAGRIMSVINSIIAFGNRPYNLAVCSPVSQTTALQRAFIYLFIY